VEERDIPNLYFYFGVVAFKPHPSLMNRRVLEGEVLEWTPFL
jgi:hypothetical protein